MIVAKIHLSFLSKVFWVSDESSLGEKMANQNPSAEQAPKIVQRDAASLAAGYLKSWRYLEILSVLAFAGLSIWIFFKLSPYTFSYWYLAISATLLGLISADFVSGLVHWMGDTWGNADWPIVGKTLIRTFREHHVDQEAITRHDFIETNGMNCMVSLPALVLALVLPLSAGQPVMYFLVTWIYSLTLWVLATNQIHKWSHQKTRPQWITFLQNKHLILPPEHHSIHHAAPYSKYYCITTGWLNAPLSKIDFFRKSERLITKLTGAIPRQDDVGKDAALDILVNEK